MLQTQLNAAIMQTKKVSSIFNMYRSRNYPRTNLKLFSHHCKAGTNGKTNYIITCLFRKLKQPKEKSFISLVRQDLSSVPSSFKKSKGAISDHKCELRGAFDLTEGLELKHINCND